MMRQPKVKLRKDYTTSDWRKAWDLRALKVASKVLPPLQALWYIISLMYTMGCQRESFGTGRVKCSDLPGSPQLCATCLLRERIDITSRDMKDLWDMWWGAFGR